MQTIHTMKIGLKGMYEDSPHKVITFGAIYILYHSHLSGTKRVDQKAKKNNLCVVLAIYLSC